MLTQTLKKRRKVCAPSIRIIWGVPFSDYRLLEPKVLAEIDRNSFIHFVAAKELGKTVLRNGQDHDWPGASKVAV
jgi:hypothetical protein